MPLPTATAFQATGRRRTRAPSLLVTLLGLGCRGWVAPIEPEPIREHAPAATDPEPSNTEPYPGGTDSGGRRGPWPYTDSPDYYPSGDTAAPTDRPPETGNTGDTGV